MSTSVEKLTMPFVFQLAITFRSLGEDQITIIMIVSRRNTENCSNLPRAVRKPE
jgi:hypothetical protein